VPDVPDVQHIGSAPALASAQRTARVEGPAAD